MKKLLTVLISAMVINGCSGSPDIIDNNGKDDENTGGGQILNLTRTRTPSLTMATIPLTMVVTTPSQARTTIKVTR